MNLFKKFPSFNYVINSSKQTFIRFPFTLINAVIGTVVAILLVENNFGSEEILQKILLLSFLGLPLFTALSCFTEKKMWPSGKRVLLHVIGIILLVLYYFTLKGKLFELEIVPIRFLLLNIGLHFLVAFLPYLGKNQHIGFWQFNKTLFLRFLLSALYSGVLYGGLAIALVAADYLFGVDLNEKVYVYLWFVMAGIFNTWLFLAGIPKDLDSLNQDNDYPSGLKVFAQYILLPLVGLYFLILISYELKIIITMNLPKGWISQMVLWYAVVGILSMLLLYPLRNRSENRWILIFSKWFFRILVPLIGMLWFAIIIRISDYGVTENRYFVIAMALGLSIVVVYFIFSKVKDIRIIPITLCLIAFLSAYGPWSAFSISLKSQKSRLTSYFTKNELLKDGYLIESKNPLPFEDRKEISSILQYLHSRYGNEVFKEWLDDSTYTSIDSVNRYSFTTKITELIGFKYLNEWEVRENKQYFNIYLNENDLFNVKNYDYMFKFTVSKNMAVSSTDYNTVIEQFDYALNIDSTNTLLIKIDSTAKQFDSSGKLKRFDSTGKLIDLSGIDHEKSVRIEIPLTNHIKNLLESEVKSNVSIDEMTVEVPSDILQAKIIIRDLNGNIHQDTLDLNSLSGYMLIRTE